MGERNFRLVWDREEADLLDSLKRPWPVWRQQQDSQDDRIAQLIPMKRGSTPARPPPWTGCGISMVNAAPSLPEYLAKF
jgi:hypothetical protein